MGKRLGQHFLKNPEIAKQIVEALDLRAGDTVIEVGAGRGELTRELLQELPLGRLIMIEKDSMLAHELARNFQFPNKFQIPNSRACFIEGDALKALPEITEKLKGEYKLVGNIPYYITGRLLRVIGELEHKPEVTILMIQKEVAERVSAKPPRMNLLAASVQAWADVETLFSVSKKEFKPMPKVESAVIRLRLKTEDGGQGTEDRGQRNDYYKLIKILFKQPRKTILNNLFAGFDAQKEELARVLQDAHVSPSDRPQTLSVELITKLAWMLYNR